MPQQAVTAASASARMAFMKNLERLVQGAKQAEVLSAKSMEDGSITCTLLVDGEELTLSFHDVRLVEGSLQEALSRPRNLRGRYNRVKNGPELSVEELERRNLPLYWNEKWLRDEFARHGSYAEIARVHGYPTPTTIASYAKRHFGMSVQAHYDQIRQAVLADFQAGGYTRQELAEKHGVGVATVYRWLREGTPASRRRGRRTKSPEQRQRDKSA